MLSKLTKVVNFVLFFSKMCSNCKKTWLQARSDKFGKIIVLNNDRQRKVKL